MKDLEYINIDKSLIPYKFDISLENITYTFKIDYNSLHDFFTVDLYKEDEVLVLGEKLVYGKPLFLSAMYKDIPSLSIIPYDLSERTERITYENFSKEVFLFLVGDYDVD